jgi:two-component system alkaline phosphatase synthesis response regulator PhoP
MQLPQREAVGMGEMTVQTDTSVLVVDDEPQVAWVLRFSLEHEGFRTYTASNGIEALEELQKHSPRVIVLDLMMPEMDGWTVMERIRKLPLDQRPRIVIVSALTGPEEKAKATALGADAFVPKPFDVEELIGVLGGLAKAS